MKKPSIDRKMVLLLDLPFRSDGQHPGQPLSASLAGVCSGTLRKCKTTK